MKLSIAIPTRSREAYLKSCLQSVLLAADKTECPVEIIVSDNASDDGTTTLINSFKSNKIIYSRLENRVSMRQNFENALSMTSGTHVIVIGDDDGILPNGLRVLEKLIAGSDAEIIKWRTMNFIWPDNQLQIPGHIDVRPLKITGRIQRLNTGPVIDRVFAGKHRNYSDGGMIYHGCISRRLIDKVRSMSDGTYFWCSSPDVYSSMANLMASETDILKIDRPISIGGASPRSNGDGAKKVAQTGDITASQELMSFINESMQDSYRTDVADSCMSLELHVLGALELVCKFQKVPFRINKKNWMARVEKEVSTFSTNAVPACKYYFEHIFGTELAVEASKKPKGEPTGSSNGVKADLINTPRYVKCRLMKTTIFGGPEMSNIATAAKFLDDLVINSNLSRVLHPSFPLIEIMRLRKKLKLIHINSCG